MHQIAISQNLEKQNTLDQLHGKDVYDSLL